MAYAGPAGEDEGIVLSERIPEDDDVAVQLLGGLQGRVRRRG